MTLNETQTASRDFVLIMMLRCFLPIMRTRGFQGCRPASGLFWASRVSQTLFCLAIRSRLDESLQAFLAAACLATIGFAMMAFAGDFAASDFRVRSSGASSFGAHITQAFDLSGFDSGNTPALSVNDRQNLWRQI